MKEFTRGLSPGMTLTLGFPGRSPGSVYIGEKLQKPAQCSFIQVPQDGYAFEMKLTRPLLLLAVFSALVVVVHSEADPFKFKKKKGGFGGVRYQPVYVVQRHRPSYGHKGFGHGGFHQSSFGHKGFGRPAYGHGSFHQSSFAQKGIGRPSYGGYHQQSSFGHGGYGRPNYGHGGYQQSSFGHGGFNRPSYGHGGYQQSSYGHGW
ncbi:chorion protein S15 [Penaeus vannamei]|uniref:chorion protein S15 n=1 Tax=Penaeus vannamei TaxID=6689 RepID=UPI00387F623C